MMTRLIQEERVPQLILQQYIKEMKLGNETRH
jgi:hypothetical protein